MIKLCADYCRLILFCSGLLIGIQIPAVVDQYAKRVDAHLTEAMDILSGFQMTAYRYFEGDMQALIAHYNKSDDPVFEHDAANIRYIVSRVITLQDETTLLNQSAVMGAAHVLFKANPDIFQETLDQYSYVIQLKPHALLWGVASGILLAILLDVLLSLFRHLLFGRLSKALKPTA